MLTVDVIAVSNPRPHLVTDATHFTWIGLLEGSMQLCLFANLELNLIIIIIVVSEHPRVFSIYLNDISIMVEPLHKKSRIESDLGDSAIESSTDEDGIPEESTVESGLLTPADETCTIIARVLKKSDMQRYMTKDGQERVYCILYVADDTKCATIRMYRWPEKSSSLDPDEGETYTFRRLIRLDEKKRNESFLARYNIAIIRHSKMHIPKSVRKESKAHEYKPLQNSTRMRRLEEAIYAEDNSTVTGKIVKVRK